ncbi:MAG: OmpA family protein [Flavobacterium sp.]|nr:MAG: OmpA family protein [Flavobacterium sp.]
MGQKLVIGLLMLFCITAYAQEEYPVYFDVDKDIPNKQSLTRLKTWIKDNEDVEVYKIYAYADSTAGSQYNLDLSKRRAVNVFKFLKKNSIKVSEIAEVRGFGETNVFSENLSNDRLAIIYYTKKTEGRVAATLPPEITQSVIDKPLDPEKTIYTAGKGDKIIIKGLYFYTDEARIVPASLPVLEQLASAMKSNPKLKIDIQGHMCCSEDKTNLSGDRARTVYQLLLKNGIDRSRMTFKGFGSSRPIYKLPENNDEEMAANKRVEIEIVAN